MNLFTNAEHLSGHLFRVVDHGPETLDRLTVMFSDGDALCMAPGGISYWSDSCDPAFLAEAVEDGRAVDLSWSDLDGDSQGHILARLNEVWRETLADVAGKWATTVAGNRDRATVNEGGTCCGGEGLYLDESGRYMIRRNGPAEDDLGPYECPAEALRATLPQWYDLAGPEYHSGALPEWLGAGSSPSEALGVAVLHDRVRDLANALEAVAVTLKPARNSGDARRMMDALRAAHRDVMDAFTRARLNPD